MNIIDKAVEFFAPGAALRRERSRAILALARQHVRKYEAAGRGRRTDDWQAHSTSAAAEIHLALATLRNRSRDLARNNPYGRNAVKKIATNVVGTGIIPNVKIPSRQAEKRLKKYWYEWANSTKCDYDGHLNFAGIEWLVMRTVAESGECLVRKRVVPGEAVPLQLQVIEGDYIDTMKEGPTADGGLIRYGVEFNDRGKIVAYWLYDQHPGDGTIYAYNSNSTRHPADEIIHVFEKERPGQFRGVPAGASSMLRMRDLDQYEDAQLIRQKIAACFSVFVSNPNGAILPGATQTDLTEKVEPGIIQHLNPGEQIAFAAPPPTEGYSDYTKNVLRGIAVGYGIDYVTLTGDLTSVNFSSGRMGWLEFNRNVSDWQEKMLIPMFCDKVWAWFLQIATISMVLKANSEVNVSWATPRREQINPEAETKAAVSAIQNGITAWSDYVSGEGYTPEEQIEKMKADMERFKSAGLPLYTMPGGVSAATAPYANQSQQDVNNQQS